MQKTATQRQDDQQRLIKKNSSKTTILKIVKDFNWNVNCWSISTISFLMRYLLIQQTKESQWVKWCECSRPMVVWMSIKLWQN